MKKIAVITGGTSGIGLATAKELEKMGFETILISLSNPENLKNHYVCNVADEQNVKSIFEQIIQKYGQINVLVNCAGFGVSGALELIDDEQIKNIFDVNVRGVINCSKCAIPAMKKGDLIINISSACGLFPLPYRSLYCASKASVNMVSYGFRMELSNAKIKVVNVCPGDVKTNFTKNRVKDFKTNERYANRVKNAAEFVDSKEEKRMKPEKVAKVLAKVTQKKNPKPLIIIGAKYKFFYFMYKIVPLRMFIWFMDKYFGGYGN